MYMQANLWLITVHYLAHPPPNTTIKGLQSKTYTLAQQLQTSIIIYKVYLQMNLALLL